MDITPLIQLVLASISAALTIVLVPYIRSKTSQQERADLMDAVRVAVQAAEQIYKGIGMGATKKEYVEAWLVRHGYTLSNELIRDDIDVLIESAVLELNKE